MPPFVTLSISIGFFRRRAIRRAEAQAAGEIDSHFDATELAEFLLASCEGVILRMRVERGPAALERFKKIMFETVFKEQK